MTPHLYLPGPWRPDDVALPDRTRHHLAKVLRQSDGAAVTYTDGRGTIGHGSLVGDSISRGEESTVSRPPELEIAVAAPHRQERVRFLVEKLTELGVTRLLWLETERAQKPPPSPDKAQAWVAGAVEQSGRAWAPEVDGPVKIGALQGSVAVAVPGAGAPQWKELVESGARFVVGPEGGFSPGELEALATATTLGHMAQFGLGSATLRTETAAIAIAAIIASVRTPG
ncbi:MAG: 16S rRNA (uracil(1498)-N(3))-methyltransferase [Acidimicrobiia bacterium]|nr:16S rRNA (uracil(1498)-N(3))-methyltransferase [Acidimicrobiia bacterium]